MASQYSNKGINREYLPQMPAQAPRSGASSTGTTSPVDAQSGGGSIRFLSSSNSPNIMGSSTANVRMNAGSPSHDFGSRPYGNKRAREIQAAEGVSPQIWATGPPTSGHSTPLRETIPESPNSDSFPDFGQADGFSGLPSTTRRPRAGTLPSRLANPVAPPGSSFLMPSTSLIPKTTVRSARSTSPYTPSPGTPNDSTQFSNSGSVKSGLPSLAGLSASSRLRAGSMPQRPGYSSAFGNSMNSFGSSSLFSSGWANGRGRSSTLASIASQPSNGPSSPQSLTRELADSDRTLDYLGLSLDSPQPPRAMLEPSIEQLMLEGQRTASSQNYQNNRIRSYSVNATEQYGADDDEMYGSGSMTPNADYATLAEQIRQHNLDVQLFTREASSARPRARTASVLDAPSTRMMRNYLPSRLDSTLNAEDILANDVDLRRLNEAVQSLQVQGQPGGHDDEVTMPGPTRALWLGNIPASTTVSTLTTYFGQFGEIESARVLTHKNCGFVNFTTVESAIQAKKCCNNKDIFPGNNPIRINFAKVPSAAATPGHNGLYPSPSPDPHAKAQADANGAPAGLAVNGNRAENGTEPLKTPKLSEIRSEISQIVKELGATDDELKIIDERVAEAIRNDDYRDEIPTVEEPSHTRTHDAPKLRDIRKRIDNSSYSAQEIEEVAMAMLPEIAELSSDYLGNTVVQKLFEFCTDETKEAMLREIAPHLATIGTHKNGTWAAQKIIEVARRAPKMQKIIVEAIRPYTLGLFYDQFGNYVVQGCLHFGAPLNDFIFEAMLSHLWDLGQGRFSARAMRACLESHDSTKYQQRMVAAAIALHSGQLATQQNSALLLTWFLDTCTFPKRRTVLVPRIIPSIVKWCTHRLACTTVLKIVNQRNEPDAREAIINALFFSPNDEVLESILSGEDVQGGCNLIFKVLTTPHFDEQVRAEAHEHVRNVLLRIKATPNGYKRLMDEVNLSTRGGSGHRDHSQTRTNSARDSPANAHVDPAGRPMYPGMIPAGYDPIALQRTGSMESNGFEQYPIGVNAPMYIPQMQYQQQVMAAPRNGQYYAPMTGFQPPVSGMDAFRNVASVPGPAYGVSPMLQPAGVAQGLGPLVGAQMYPYGPTYVQQQQPVNRPRRGQR